MMRKFFLVILGLTLMAAMAAPSHAGVTANEAFTQLKGMAGTWTGSAAGEGAEAEAAGEEIEGQAVHEIQVSAAGTVVMETMAPGTPHEMINMYHLDGEELVLTHYCAGGNQPTMKLDRAASTANKLVFDFTGGTNLDPAIDNHIHSAEIHWTDDNHIESVWNGYSGGKPTGVMTFQLAKE